MQNAYVLPHIAFHSRLACRHGYNCQCDLLVSGEIKTLKLQVDEGRVGVCLLACGARYSIIRASFAQRDAFDLEPPNY